MTDRQLLIRLYEKLMSRCGYKEEQVHMQRLRAIIYDMPPDSFAPIDGRQCFGIDELKQTLPLANETADDYWKRTGQPLRGTPHFSNPLLFVSVANGSMSRVRCPDCDEDHVVNRSDPEWKDRFLEFANKHLECGKMELQAKPVNPSLGYAMPSHMTLESSDKFGYYVAKCVPCDTGFSVQTHKGWQQRLRRFIADHWECGAKPEPRPDEDPALKYECEPDVRKYSTEPGSETGPQGGTFDREPRMVYVNMHGGRGGYAFPSKSEAESDLKVNVTETAVPFREVLPGQAFMADWADSGQPDHRHPAYSLGESDAMGLICLALEKTMDGDFRGRFVEPLESIRKRIVELVKQSQQAAASRNDIPYPFIAAHGTYSTSDGKTAEIVGIREGTAIGWFENNTAAWSADTGAALTAGVPDIGLRRKIAYLCYCDGDEYTADNPVDHRPVPQILGSAMVFAGQWVPGTEPQIEKADEA